MTSREPDHEREYKNRVYFALRRRYPELTKQECKILEFAAGIHKHHPDAISYHPIPDAYMGTIAQVGECVEILELKTTKN
jgi:hypothetical protein